MSLASEPELPKNTRDAANGAMRYELVGEQNAGLVALAREEMRERQLLDLVVRRARELVVAVAERRAPEPGHRFDVLLAAVVPHVHALAAHEDERRAAVQRREIGVRMQHALEIERTEIDLAKRPARAMRFVSLCGKGRR